MTEKKKASAGTAIPTLAVENGPIYQTAHVSTKNCTISAAGRQFQIADLLLRGQDNAVSRRDLMSLTGLRDRCVRSLRRRAKEIAATATAIEGGKGAK